MLFAYARDHSGLKRRAADAAPEEAVWIDLLRPSAEEIAMLGAMDVMVPSLAEMEEIEISNRLYRENGADYMTVVLPGMSETQTPISGPVTFILTSSRLVTVRHHAPRPFETYPDRANKATAGCTTPE
ncbi:MAG: magnesium transporter, partial [Paracoccaceae bacterium]|nr:magnesium transporter [Paracoccaceae bacterium]